ncbi:MAG: DUF302 domain-containing protein [Pseudomonadota bacterium]
MLRNFKKTTALLVALGGMAAGGASAADAGSIPEGVTAYEVTAAFEDVRFDLENAIVNRGLVIDYVSHIGTMLDRTAADVGSDKKIYENAEAMLFCSADLSRKAMEADPANIAYCPYTVFVYETPGTPGQVTVGFRNLSETGSDASKSAIAEVNKLLNGIAKEAAGE